MRNRSVQMCVPFVMCVCAGLAFGVEDQKLVNPIPSAQDQFGFAVSVAGPWVVVGANLDDQYGLNSGAAYLFNLETDGPAVELAPEDAGSSDQVGASVAIDPVGDAPLIAVGIPDWDEQINNGGTIAIFDALTGEFEEHLYAFDSNSNDRLDPAHLSKHFDLPEGSYLLVVERVGICIRRLRLWSSFG